MRRLTHSERNMRPTLRGTSLLETVVAAVLFLTVFAAATELLPRLTLREDDALIVAETRYRLECACGKYATGLWPCGEYAESFHGGEIAVRIEPYRGFSDVQCISLAVQIPGHRKQLTLNVLVACAAE